MTTTDTRYDDDVLEPAEDPNAIDWPSVFRGLLTAFDIARLGCSLATGMLALVVFIPFALTLVGLAIRA